MTVPQDSSNTFVFDVRRIVKQSLTKKSRTDLGRAMIRMCSLTGWQSTTLNPDMTPEVKLTILSKAYEKIHNDVNEPILDATHPGIYADLIELSACTMGWAQGDARRKNRDRKRRNREKRKERKRARKLEKKAARRVAEQQESAT